MVFSKLFSPVGIGQISVVGENYPRHTLTFRFEDPDIECVRRLTVILDDDPEEAEKAKDRRMHNLVASTSEEIAIDIIAHFRQYSSKVHAECTLKELSEIVVRNLTDSGDAEESMDRRVLLDNLVFETGSYH